MPLTRKHTGNNVEEILWEGQYFVLSLGQPKDHMSNRYPNTLGECMSL